MMAILGSGVRFLWALLAFASTIHGQTAAPDPITDFCSLSIHMSEGAPFRYWPSSYTVLKTY